MATIQQSLKEIEILQEKIFEKEFEDEFQSRLTNITTVIYFDHLSHAVLHGARKIDLSTVDGAKKYYELYSKQYLLQECIRINFVGHFFNIWMEYERFLRRKSKFFFGEEKFKISTVFDRILDLVEDTEKGKFKNEFDVIRLTRNSLHDGGIYRHGKPFKGKIGNQTYIFVPYQPVIPIRNLDVVKTIWEHFLIIDKIDITSKSSS